MIVESGLCLIQEFDFSLFDPSWRTVDSYVTLISTCETEGHDPRRWLAIHQKVTEFIRDHYLKPVQSTLGAVALYTSELLRLVSSTYLSVDGRVSVASGYFWLVFDFSWFMSGEKLQFARKTLTSVFSIHLLHRKVRIITLKSNWNQIFMSKIAFNAKWIKDALNV